MDDDLHEPAVPAELSGTEPVPDVGAGLCPRLVWIELHHVARNSPHGAFVAQVQEQLLRPADVRDPRARAERDLVDRLRRTEIDGDGDELLHCIAPADRRLVLPKR